jgi:hypothetical protein
MTSIMEPQIAAAPRKFARKTRPQPGDKQYGRSRITNGSGLLSGVDGRSTNARRCRDLRAMFLAALGPDGASDLTRMLAKKAAELVTMAESMRSNMLAGVAIDLTALIRIEGEARRTLTRLGIKVEPPPAKARGLTLARARWAEAEARKAEKAKTAGEAMHTTEAPDGC